MLYLAPNADPLLFTNRTAAERAAAEAGIMSRIRAVSLDTKHV